MEEELVLNGEGELVFDDLAPKQLPVRINKVLYYLKEATEDAASKFRNESMRGARFVDGEIQSVSNVGDLQPLLVSLCLWEQYDEHNQRKERPVPLPVVRRWPSKVVKKLFNWVKQVSELEDADDTEESLLKQINKLQTKLNKLRSARAAAELSRSQLGLDKENDQAPLNNLGNG